MTHPTPTPTPTHPGDFDPTTIYVVIGRDSMDPRRLEREEADSLDEADNIAAQMESEGLSVTITEDHA